MLHGHVVLSGCLASGNSKNHASHRLDCSLWHSNICSRIVGHALSRRNLSKSFWIHRRMCSKFAVNVASASNVAFSPLPWAQQFVKAGSSVLSSLSVMANSSVAFGIPPLKSISYRRLMNLLSAARSEIEHPRSESSLARRLRRHVSHCCMPHIEGRIPFSSTRATLSIHNPSTVAGSIRFWRRIDTCLTTGSRLLSSPTLGHHTKDLILKFLTQALLDPNGGSLGRRGVR